MPIDYLTYDVFTAAPFGGNPLAVLPEAQKIPEEQLQKIAREFNYSETVFLYPPEDAANTARLRIFTPFREVPFAGHPTIGAAVALSELGHGSQNGPDMRLELKIGLIEATAAHGRAAFTTTTPLSILARPPRELAARCLGLYPDQIGSAPVLAGVGLEFTFVELTSRAALASCSPDPEAMRDGVRAYPSSHDFAVAAYFREGDTLHMRMFAPLDGVPEDPATGSASAALVRLLAEQESRDLSLTIHQGDDMGRPSRITATANARGTTIGGHALRMMEGRLLV
ncbi:PhzF family phenazine biosynthesis protein [Celeribacter neptunius]|uniref:Trans-2,3-dihydro-3-hydroxyanthranilate isomerase n=1 Tax=Celeribacter neptunius TaxID=588602 RepID=A0A1I3K4N8_9RHOB|nr:PhzF family phenazine biosynthesis protein [Celeribacter neptunius]SFI67270.1 trans-2,3-dihydro-3-hydroxyanthranilate isomerase [Celeribacter neptunius]